MNRRDALAAIAAMPVVGSVTIVDKSEAMPILAVFEFPQKLTSETRARIRQEWKEVFSGRPPFPALLLDGGARVNFVSRERAEQMAKEVENG